MAPYEPPPLRDGHRLLYDSLILSSVLGQEAWKYGERTLRYCNHDAGYAIAAVAVSAASLSWDSRLADYLGHDDLIRLLGVDKTYSLSHPPKGSFSWIEAQHLDCFVLKRFEFGDLEWDGKSVPLSKMYVYWNVIYQIHVVVLKENDWVFVGIYDGFNGHDTTDYLLSNLYPSVQAELQVLWSQTHLHVLKALSWALRKTESAYFDVVDSMSNKNPELALMETYRKLGIHIQPNKLGNY